MKVCLVGLGNWGKNHARVLSQLKTEGKINELYFYDTNSDLLNKMCNFYQATPVTNLDGLDVDFVDVVVPANLHHSVAKPFVERGIKTFIEKPFTDDEQDALELMDLSKNPETMIMIGQIFRFHEGVIYSKQLVERGMIGELRKVDVRRLFFGKPRLDNGVILSLGIHDLDIISFYNNDRPPNSIECMMSTIVGPTEDHAFIKANYDNFVGIAEESWMSPSTGKIRSCSVQGNNGEIFFDFLNPSEVTTNFKYIEDTIVDNGTFKHSIEFQEPLKTELTHFIDRGISNEEFRVGPKIGLNAMRLCFAALESAKTGRRIQIEQDFTFSG